MRFNNLFLLIIICCISITGCTNPNNTPPVTSIPTQTSTPITETPIPPTQTVISTLTPTPLNTLEPEQAKETIRTLLQDSVDCDAPCFWGITPGQTTLNEAIDIFTHMGLQVKNTTYQGTNFYGIEYGFDSGLSISVILTIQNEIVENLRIKMLPEKLSAGVTRMWSAYSPETLINRYGSPSKVDFFIDRGPNLLFVMDMYFDSVDLIVEYGITNVTPYQNSPRICPITAQFDSVRAWLGKDPYTPPSELVPLEKATSLTIDQFTQLMLGDAEKACFTLKGNAFP